MKKYVCKDCNLVTHSRSRIQSHAEGMGHSYKIIAPLNVYEISIKNDSHFPEYKDKCKAKNKEKASGIFYQRLKERTTFGGGVSSFYLLKYIRRIES